ncbi:hypothetical protein BGW38_009822, partial [Lunasporangiospora selenospora]
LPKEPCTTGTTSTLLASFMTMQTRSCRLCSNHSTRTPRRTGIVTANDYWKERNFGRNWNSEQHQIMPIWRHRVPQIHCHLLLLWMLSLHH